jgi:amidophosphoribosyltransferase
MCGIIGLLLATDETANVNQLLFDGLTVLQHRGQDAAGMVTMDRKKKLHLRKENGLVKDVFERQHMKELLGNMGLGHCRYPTAGSSSCAEAQPLYTNYPYGICVAHNGNLTNTRELMDYLEETALRHINTESDSELLLNFFAEQLMKETQAMRKADPSNEVDMKKAIFLAMTELMAKCKGGYAGMFLINNYGLVGFRDPNGIRPLVFGCRESSATMSNDSSHSVPGTPGAMDHAAHSLDYVIASESVAIDTLGFRLVRYDFAALSDCRSGSPC